MGRIRTIENYQGKKFELYGYKSNSGLYYLLAMPEQFNENCNMIVESYNSNGKQKESYEQNVVSALNDGNRIENFLMEVVTDAPIVMPITPDIIEGPDTQQLSEESIMQEEIDTKFLSCIEEAKQKVQKISGKKVGDKIFLDGYSASGVFAQRFALAYPEIIDRCLIGGAAGTIPIPSTELDYPLGIGNYEELFGKEFDEAAYKQIQFAYYVGEHEEREPGSYDINGDKIINDKQVAAPMHDMSYREITTKTEVGKKQREILGETMDERYKNSIEYCKKIGIDISGIILRGAYHHGILDDKVNPSAEYLKNSILEFYYEGKQFKSDSVNCVEKLNETFQKNRNERNSTLEK